MSKLLDRFRYFKQAIASVGSSTKSCVPPTVLTVQAPVAGKSTLKMVW